MNQESKSWAERVIKQEEIDKYLVDGKDFIDEEEIDEQLKNNVTNDKDVIRNILNKSLNIERLSFEETATLLNVTDNDLWEEMYKTAAEVKRRVYDNRIVFFAPLYCGNLCVNNCKYCGFRKDNKGETRKVLSFDEIREETECVISEGHKRMIVVFGEHPKTDADYIAKSMEEIYKVEKKSKNGRINRIRRINVNAAPMCIDDLKKLKDVGIGTFQVFQETYKRDKYEYLHPSGPKSDYRWRLYALHRAMDAGVDDVAIGALFGLYDWKFEVMALIRHAADLERLYGIGPHTISFPRINPASGTTFDKTSEYIVNDEDFKKIVTVLRLAVPYTGLIITAREQPELKKDVINVGCTQTDASTKIGIGGYSKAKKLQDKSKQQFMLGDTRSLDEVIKELADMGKITSFCTAGYRCGRTGEKIMGLLEKTVEGKFCKLNAVLTFREYLDDYASEETKAAGEKLILKELDEIAQMDFYKDHKLDKVMKDYYERISKGERDLYI